MSNGLTHDCPGGCGRQVTHDRLACRRCWYRLPSGLRGRIWRAWWGGSDSRAAHGRAIREAEQWFRDNPPPQAH